MKNKNKITLLIFALLMFLPSLASANEFVDDGVIDFGTSADFPPYEYYEGEDIVGIDPDIIKEIGDYLDIEVKIHDMDFNNILASIQSNKLDAGAAGFTVTEERKKSVNFTDTFAKTSQVVLVKQDSQISTIDELRKNKKIGTQLGSIGHTLATDDFGEENVSAFVKVPDAVLALKTGKIDAVIVDKEIAENYKASDDKLGILDKTYVEEEYAIAVNKNNEALLEKLNQAIGELKKDGTIDKIMAKYEGSSELSEGKGLIGRFKATIIDNGGYKYLLDGLKTTIIVTSFALIISFSLGLIIAITRAASEESTNILIKILDKVFTLFVTIIRGTPSTIQLLIMFNVILVNLDNLLLVAVLSFALNSSAYMAEIFRGGINAVDKGEKEAARSLGLTYYQTMRKVIMPQAIKNSLPALANEIITLFKETSISGFIGLADLTRGASIVISQTFDAGTAYFSAAIIYLVIVMVMEKIFKKIEKGLQYA